MSREIEEKVVEMRFDNKNFEKNAAESMNTIEKLKKALNFNNVAKGLKVLTDTVNRITFKKLDDAVDSIADKFSALEVAERAFITNLTNTATDAGKRLVKSLTLDQVSAAFDKYTDKTSYVQTIMNATGKSVDEVNKYLDKLMWFSDETSYSFTDMTQAVGGFVSSGADIEKVIPLVTGIANATAYAGKSAREFSSVLYNLNQSYSLGYIQALDWKSVSGMGVDTEKLKEELIQAGIALGTLTKEGKTAKGQLVTTSNIMSTFAEKWATTEVMEKAFGSFSEFSDAVYKAVNVDKIYDTTGEAIEAMSGQFSNLSETAFKAGQQSKSFTESIEATKDAVSSGWMRTFEIIFGNITEATELWSELTEDLWELFAAGDAARNELFTDAFRGTSGWVQLQNAIAGTGIPIDNFKEQLVKTARTYNESIDDMIAEAGSFENSLQEGWLTTDIVEKTMSRYIYAVGGFADYTKVAAGEMVDLETIVNKVLNHELGEGVDQIHAIEDAGYDAVFVQELVSRTLRGETIDYENLSKAQADNLGYNREQILAMKELAKAANSSGSSFNEAITNVDQLSGRDLLIDTFRNALESMITVNDIFKESFSEAFNLDSDALYSVLDAIHNLSTYLIIDEEHAEYLKSTFKGLFSILDILGTTIKTGVTKGFELFKAIIGDTNIDVLKFTGSIGDSLQAFAEFYKSGDLAGKAFDFISENILKAITKVKEFGASFKELPFVQNILSKIVELIDQFKSVISIDFDEVSGAITRIDIDFNKIGETILSVFNSVSNRGKEFENNLTTTFDNVQTKFINFGTKFIDFFKYIGESIKKINFYPIIAAGFTVAFITVIAKAVNMLTILQGFADRILDIVEDIGGAYAKLTKAKAFESTSRGVLQIAISIGILAAALALLAKVGKDGGDLGKAAGTLAIAAGVVVAASVLLGLTNKLLGKAKLRNAATIIVSLSASLLLLVGALKMVGQLSDSFTSTNGDGVNKLSEGLKVICELLAALSISAALIGLTNKDINKSALSIVAFAVAVRILIRSLNLISSDTITNVNNNAAMFALLAAALIGLVAVSKNFSGTAGLGFVGISTGIFVLVAAMKELRKLSDAKIVTAISYLSSLIISFGIMSKIMGKESGEFAGKIGLGLMGIAVAVNLIVPALYTLGRIPSDVLVKGSAVVGGLLGIMGLIANYTRRSGKYAIQAGTMILMMSAAMVALTGLVAVLGSMDTKTVIQGTAAVVAIEGMLGAIVAHSTFSENSQKVLGKIFVILTLLNGVLIYLAKFTDTKQALAASASISMVLLSLAAAFGMLGSSKKFKMGKNGIRILRELTILAGALSLVTVAYTSVFNKSGPKQIVAVSAGIGIMMMSLAKACQIISKADELKEDNIKPMLQTFAVLGLFASALGAVVVGLVGFNNAIGNTGDDSLTNILAFSLGLSALMISLSTALRIVSNLDITTDVKKAGTILLTLTGITSLLGLVVAGLSHISGDPVHAIAVTGSMSILLLSLAGCIKILSGTNFNSNLNNSVIVLGTLGVVAGLLSGLAVHLANKMQDVGKAYAVTGQMILLMGSLIGLTTLASLASNLANPSTMLNFMISMAEMIGGIGIVIGAIGGINLALKSLTGDELSLTELLAQFNEITTELGKGIGSFFGAIGQGAKAAKMDSSGSQDDIDAYAQELMDAGDAVAQFADTVGNADLSGIADAKDYIQMLAEVEAEIVKTGGFKGLIEGNIKWSTLSEGLAGVATAMVSFSKEVGNNDLSNIKTVKEPITNLTEIMHLIPESGGVLQHWLGESEWATVSKGLAGLAFAMVKFNWILKLAGDLSNITTEVGYVESFTKALSALPKNTNATFIGKIFGTTDWTVISNGLESVATAIKTFNFNMSNIKEEDLNASIKNLEAFMAIKMPKSQTALDKFFTGKKDWSSISNGLPTLGAAINAFATKMVEGGVEVRQIEAATKCLEIVAKLAGGVISQMQIDDLSITYFNQVLVDFAAAIVEVSTKTKDIDIDGLKKLVQSLVVMTQICNLYKDIKFDELPSEESINHFAEVARNFASAARRFYLYLDDVDSNTLKNYIDSVVALFDLVNTNNTYDGEFLTKFADDLRNAGDLGITSFISNMTDDNIDIATAAKNLITAFVKALDDALIEENENIKSKAKTAADSFSDGFASKSEDIKDAILNTIQTSVDKITTISETFKSLGETASQGLIDGLNTGLVYINSENSPVAIANKRLKKIGKREKTANRSAVPTRSALDTVNNVYNNVKDNGLLGGLMQSIGDVTGLNLTSIEDIGAQIADGITGPMQDSVEDFVSNLGNTLEDSVVDTGVTESLEEQTKRRNKLLKEGKAEYDKLVKDYVDGRITQSEYDSRYTSLLSKYSEVQEDLFYQIRENVIKAAKKEYDDLFESYKNGKMEQAEYDKKYTELLTKYSEIQNDINDYASNKLLKDAKKEYDKLIQDYKKGRIDQMLYDQKYTDLLAKNTQVQVELMDYADEKMQDVLDAKFDKINSDYETNLGKIQTQIDNFVSKNTGSFGELFTFKTNKDVYDEKLDEYSKKNDEYQKQLDEYSKKLDESIEKWGENNAYADGYRYQIEQIQNKIKKNNEEMEKYKKEYADSGVKDDDIVDTFFPTDQEMQEKIDKVNEYRKKYTELQGRNVSQTILDAVSEKDEKEALAAMDYLLGKTDKELKDMSSKWDEYTTANEGLANLIYSPKIKEATDKYQEDIINTLGTLPESAKEIGYDIALSLSDGLSDSVEPVLSQIGMTLDDIYKGIESSVSKMQDPLGTALNNLVDTAVNYFAKSFAEKIDLANVMPITRWTNGLTEIRVSGGNLPIGLSTPNNLYDSTYNTKKSMDQFTQSSALSNQMSSLTTSIDNLNQENAMQNTILADIASKMDGISLKMNNTDIVLDTGALAGGMVDKMDKLMGKRNLLRIRGC